MENKGKILVAEDYEPGRKLIGNLLNIAAPDYEKILYSNGHSLEEELNNSSNGIKLIVLDNDVPDKGLGLKLTGKYSRKGIPFVMISGTDISRESKEAGAYSFILKPFEVSNFISIIKEVLDYKK